MQELQEEFDMIQNYISTIFSCLPIVSSDSEESLLLQAVQYGKKVIQLSDKFTAKYRTEHMTNRKDIQEKIKQIYHLVMQLAGSSNTSSQLYQIKAGGLDQIVSCILNILREDVCSENGSRPSNFNTGGYTHIPLNNDALKYGSDAKNEPSFIKINYENHEHIKSPSSGVPVKKKRSSTHKSSKKVGQGVDGKTFWNIKGIFEEEQKQIHKLFQKISKIVYSNPQLNSSVLEEKLLWSNDNNQFSSSKFEEMGTLDLIRLNIKDNINKLHNLGNAIKVLDDHFERKVKMEGYSQGKFNLYLDEISKREQVYSYSVSKLLEYLSNLRDQYDGKTGITIKILEIMDNLEEIGGKFYELYPSHTIMNDLKVQKLNKQLEKVGFQNQSCQVNIGKSQKTISREISQSRRNLIELYRVTTRVSEFVERFEKSIKYKKNIENKEVEKFIDTIKDSLPKKNLGISGHANIAPNVKEQVSNYQQQLRKLLESHEKNEKSLMEDYQKKNKKIQKKVSQLQKILSETSHQLQKEREQRESEKRKYVKKLQTEKQENKKMQSLNNKLEHSIKELSLELERLKTQLRDQYDKYIKKQTELRNQNQLLSGRLSKHEALIEELNKEIEENMNKYEEEREIYHKKILMLESGQEVHTEELMKTKHELNNMIEDNKKLEKQIQELSQIYEEKIKELEYVIDNIKQLEQEIKNKDSEFNELTKDYQVTVANLQHEVNNKEILQKENTRLLASIEAKNQEVDRYKNLALLNENDIQILRDEIQKVKNAYFDADQVAEQYKTHISEVERDRDRIRKQNRELKIQVEHYTEKFNQIELTKQRLNKDLLSCKDQLALRYRESDGTQRDLEDSKKEATKLRNENQQLRQSVAKHESEVRQLRQQLQKKVESESLQSSKKRLELQALKVDLRRKSEQLEKQKSGYEQKIEILESKNQEMAQLITQKQLLAKITNSHLSQ